jgi:hypothetical protein
MLPMFLMPDSIARADGKGPSIELAALRGKLLVLTLDIDRIIEQESLGVSIWGSTNGTDWGREALAYFPRKFYCGMYSILLNLSQRPDIRYARVQWTMNRWGKGDPSPMFGFRVFAEESGSRVRAAAAGASAVAVA